MDNAMLMMLNSRKGGLQPHPETVIELAEKAFYSGRQGIARSVIENFLRRSPQKDQYYCRANVLMGLILDHEAKESNGTESIRKRKHAVGQMIIAIDVAAAPENSSRYDFVVYNTSLSCWKVMRPFMRTGRAKIFAAEVCRISAALEKCDDSDISWRIMYLSAAALCCYESQLLKSAEEAIDKAILHADKALTISLSQEQSILSEVNAASAELEDASSSLRKLDEREDNLRKIKKKIDCDAPSESVEVAYAEVMTEKEKRIEAAERDALHLKIAAALSRKTESTVKLRVTNELKSQQQTTLTRLYMQRVHTNPADSKKISLLPGIVQSVRIRSQVQLQCVVSGCVEGKDLQALLAQLIKDLTPGPPINATLEVMTDAQRVESLLDVSRVALQMGLKESAQLSYDSALKINCTASAALRVKVDLCKALQMVSESSSENANKAFEQRLTAREAHGLGVSRRIEALKLLERILPLSQGRNADFVLVQEICITMWNTLLPLLQPPLRKYVHKALQLVAKALDERDSPLTLLRAQVHFELCKCEEQADLVGKAKEEADKALRMDYGSLLDDVPSQQAVGSGAGDRGSKTPPKSLLKSSSTMFSDPTPHTAVPLNPDLDRTRPMDHLIKPLAASLALRLSVYETPTDVEGQVILMLQQAKESSSVPLHRDVLLKASAAMNGLLTSGRRVSYEDVKATPIRPVSLQEIERMLTKPKPAEIHRGSVSAAAGHVHPLEPVSPYTTFSAVVQLRAGLMVDIARLAQQPQQRNLVGKNGSPNPSPLITLKAVQYVLSHTWNPTDIFNRELIDAQIEMHFCLASSLVDRLAALEIEDSMLEKYKRECDDSAAAASVEDDSSATTATTEGTKTRTPKTVPDPRALGLMSPYATEDMSTVKRLILLALTRGLQLAALISDEVGVQNAVVHFWNTHLHIFRRKLSASAMPEVLEFLRLSSDALHTQAQYVTNRTAPSGHEKTKPPLKGTVKHTEVGGAASQTPGVGGMPSQGVDERLSLSVSEAIVEFLEVRGDYQEALQVALKATAIDAAHTGPGPGGGGVGGRSNKATISGPFLRKRLCEAACRCAGQLALKPGTAAATVVSAAVNALKFESVFLSVYASLSLAELPSELSSKETSTAATDKATRIMDNEVTSLLQLLDWTCMTQDDYDMVAEMQAEIFSRLARLNIVQGNVHSAQMLAERCLSLVAQSMEREQRGAAPLDMHTLMPPAPPGSAPPEKLSPRVWRWVSVCERYFGEAVCRVIQEEGQDKSLQRELRLAGLRHFALACTYGVRAQRMELVLQAATVAWNVTKVALEKGNLTGPSGSALGLGLEGKEKDREGNSLLRLQQQILECLLGCKQEAATIGGAMTGLSVLLQQMYVSMVTQLCDTEEWGKASTLVMEAFQHVPPPLQKPLWKLRVIVMSKQGKNVLDGVQKMIAGEGKKDLALQARVYAILARASSTGRQQLEAYRKTIELLEGDPGRVDYVLETAQWMSSYGLPRTTLTDMLLSAMDAVYEQEENHLDLANEGAKDEFSVFNEGPVSGPRSSSPSVPQSARIVVSSRAPLTSSRRQPSAKGLRSTVKAPSLASTVRRSLLTGESEEDGPGLTPGLSAKQCEQAVRTCLMLAMLQSDEAARLERLLETMYFITRSQEVWSAALKGTDKGTHWAALSMKEREECPGYAEYTPSSPGQSPTLLKIPTDAMCLLSWMPSPLFLELHAISVQQCPLRVPSAASYPLLPLTVHYLFWGAGELHRLGHQKHSLLLLAWVRAILLVIPLHKKEFVLAAAHYKALSILYSCGVRVADIEVILPMVLGSTPLTAPIFLSRIGEDAIAELSGVAPVPQGGPSADPGGDIFRVPTLTQVMGTTDASAVDTPSCILSICRSLQELGQTPLAHALIGAARVHASLRGDRSPDLTALTMKAHTEAEEGRPREALAMLILARESIRGHSDGILLSRAAIGAAKCYSKLGATDEAKRLMLETLQLLLKGCSLEYTPSVPYSAPHATHHHPNPSSFPSGHPSAHQSAHQSAYPSAHPSAPSSSCVTINRTHFLEAQGGYLEGSEVGSSIASIVTARMKGLHIAAPITEREGDLECASALVDAYSAYLTLLSEECSSSSLRGTGGADFDFSDSVITITASVGGVLDKVSSVAGRVSVLTARVLERTAEACLSCLLSMHSIDTTFGGLSASDYPLWFEDHLRSCVLYATQSVEIRRDLCVRLTDEELAYIVPQAPPKVEGLQDVAKKALKFVQKPSNAKRASRVPEMDPPEAFKLNLEESTGLESGARVRALSSSLQRDLAKAELLLACQKYHLGAFRGQHQSGGGLSQAQQRKRLADLSPPERYLEMSKPTPIAQTEDFEVRPIGEGILLAASALQALSGQSIDPSSSSSAPSSISRVCVESAAMYSIGFVMQLSGSGAFNSMWIPFGEGEEDTDMPDRSVSVPPSQLLSSLSGDSAENAARKVAVAAATSGAPMAAVSAVEIDEFIPTDPAAATARTELAAHTVAAMIARKFEVAAVGAGALVAAYGRRKVRSAVCWLLQLQSITARALLHQQWEAALPPSSEAKRSLTRLAALEGGDREGRPRDAELIFLAQSSTCWNRLDISTDPGLILAAVPFNTVVLTLQMCPHKKVLYACVGVRTIPPPPAVPVVSGKRSSINDQAAAAATIAAAAAATAAKIFRPFFAGGEWAISKIPLSESNRRQLLTLTTQHTVWCEDTSKFTAKYGEFLPSTADLEGTESTHPDLKIRKTEAALEERLRALLSDMEGLVDGLLGPKSECADFLMERFKSCFAQPSGDETNSRDDPSYDHKKADNSPERSSSVSGKSSPTASPKRPLSASKRSNSISVPRGAKKIERIEKASKKGSDSALPLDAAAGTPVCAPLPSVLLLLDPSLSCLPWEGLPVIEQFFGGKTSRDFSIHMYGHRLAALQGGSLIPPPAGPHPNLCVGASGVKVLADPFGDDEGCAAAGYERDSITSTLSYIATSKDPGSVDSVGVKWTNMAGGELVISSKAPVTSLSLSIEDWVAASTPSKTPGPKGEPPLSGAVLAYCPGRLSALLSPRDAVALSLQHLALLFVADMSLNDSSYRRQNSLDNLKRCEEICMEEPLALAAVLSLAGVGSLVVHRWSTSLAAQKKFVTTFWDSFANKKKDVCTSVAIANMGPSTLPPSIRLNPRDSAPVGVEAIQPAMNSPPPQAPGQGQGQGFALAQSPYGSARAGTGTGTGTGGTKRWVRLARINVGLPSVTYSDA